ncbi:MAG: carboxypeptidase-like regulatory domain-containing protein [Alistipes sp.]|nr:carboxypeptidase-like regulatory domain-containing protein [Alistipes sp.]
MKRFLFIVAMGLMAISAQAQQRVNGVVSDTEGKAIVGAIVKVVGTHKGVVTDLNGAYEIAAKKDATLEFAYVDYETKQIAVEGKSQINVALERSASAAESKMLYIVDGKVVSKSEVDALQPDKIKNMNVMKGVDAVTVINTKGGDVQTIVVKKDGSVSSSSTGGSNFTSTSTTTVNGKTETLEVKGLVGKPVTVRTSGTSGEPLTLVRIESGEIAKGSTNNIKADMIKSVSVIKASEKCDEFKQWGDVSNGVVFIDLKDGYTFDDIKNPVDKSDEKELKVIKVESSPRDPNASAIPKRK